MAKDNHRRFSDAELRDLISTAMKEGVFPARKTLSDLPYAPSRSLLSSRISPAEWTRLQIEWIETASTAHVVAALSQSELNHAEASVHDAVSARMVKIVRDALKTSPATFPTITSVSDLPGMPNFSVLRKHISPDRWDEMQKEWVKNATPEVLQSAISGNYMSSVREDVEREISIRLKAMVKDEAAKTPDVFPAHFSIAVPSLSREILESRVPGEDWLDMQREWVRTAAEPALWSVLSSGIVFSDELAVDLSCRLVFMVEMVLAAHQSFFPTPYSIQESNKLYSEYLLRTRIPQEEWDRMRVMWVVTTEEQNFLGEVSRGAFAHATPNVVAIANLRLASIVAEKLKTHPEVFPTPSSVSKLPGMLRARTLDSKIPKEKWQEMQIDWAQKSESKLFLAALSNSNFQDIGDEVNKAINARFLCIFKELCGSHPERFPTPTEFSGEYGMPQSQTLSRRIPQEEWNRIQVEWIKTSERAVFLQALSGKKFNNVSDKINLEVTARFTDIVKETLASHPEITSLSSLEKMFEDGANSIGSRIPNILELIQIATVLHGTRSPDQQIVSKIGFRASEREEWVNKLIEQRLEQLWLFRELVALALAGYANGATVVSFSHDSISPKLVAICGTETRHVAFEKLEDARQDAKVETTNPVILLSVLQWLSPERTASLLRNLALSTHPGTEVIFTYPANSVLLGQAEEGLGQFGFSLDRVGALSLNPPDDMRGPEAEKLRQESQIATLKRLARDPDSATTALDLFLRIQDADVLDGGVSSSSGRSYSRDELCSTSPSVVLRSASAALTQGEVPQLTRVEFSEDATSFLLTFRSGSDEQYCGVNINPDRKDTFEIEGEKVSVSVASACSAIASGKAPELVIPDDLRDHYELFLSHLKKTRCDGISARNVPASRKT